MIRHGERFDQVQNCTSRDAENVAHFECMLRNFSMRTKRLIDNFAAKASMPVLASHSAQTFRQFATRRALWIMGLSRLHLEDILKMHSKWQRERIEGA
jgi:hypothetical protein